MDRVIRNTRATNSALEKDVTFTKFIVNNNSKFLINQRYPVVSLLIK